MTIISNDDLARILGRMEAKLDAQGSATKRVEEGLSNLDAKVGLRLDQHDIRLRELEVANPKKLGETVANHALRIDALEKGAVRSGVIAGVGSGVVMAVLVELVKKKIGL
jgi:hypothetical protein